MRKFSKREIKELKKDIRRYGAINVGYYYSIEKVLTFDDFDRFLEYIKDNGLTNSIPNDYAQRLSMIITVLAEVLNYQEFKKLVPHFIGYCRLYC